jgi:hypothetical protein
MSNFESENELIRTVFVVNKIPNEVLYEPRLDETNPEFIDFVTTAVQNFLQSLVDNKADANIPHSLTINLKNPKPRSKQFWLAEMEKWFGGLNCAVNFNIWEDNKHSIVIVFSSIFTSTVYNFHREIQQYER